MIEVSKDFLISTLQAEIFDLCMNKWKISNVECSEIFDKYNIWEYIHECYDILHLYGSSENVREIDRIVNAGGELV